MNSDRTKSLKDSFIMKMLRKEESELLHEIRRNVEKLKIIRDRKRTHAKLYRIQAVLVSKIYKCKRKVQYTQYCIDCLKEKELRQFDFSYPFSIPFSFVLNYAE